MSESDVPHDPDPVGTATMVARVRRLMLIAGLTVALGIGAILSVIGYKLFRGEGSVVSAGDVTVALPKGARIAATAVAGERIIVTLDNAGALELHTFDTRTLKPAGRLRFATEP